MSLDSELSIARQEIKTDSYPITLRELASLYNDEELDIHPEFQRFLRWTPGQKTKLIESLLLGIPIPSIFLFQRSDGVLDVVDGLQRISTILQFMGILRDESGSTLERLTLGKGEYLPSMEGKVWEGQDDEDEIGEEIRRFFRQSKIDVKVLLRDSDDRAKYELFQRINTGGTPLSEQEVRNCILIMYHRDSYVWLEDLVRNESFLTCCPVPERLMLERYEAELALRFILLYSYPVGELNDNFDLRTFLTDTMISEIGGGNKDLIGKKSLFDRTFSVLAEATGDESFKKYNESKERFTGPFLISGFELVGMGVAANIELVEAKGTDWLRGKVKSIWSRSDIEGAYGQGVSTARRLPKTLRIGREHFSSD